MAVHVDLVRFTTATTGTGTLTVGAAIAPFQTPAQAGVADGTVVVYSINDGANSETGTGTYTVSGTTLSRTPVRSTNSNAAINLSGTASVFFDAIASSILNPGATSTITVGYTYTSASISTGSFTVNVATCGLQYVTNNGAYTITAPAVDGEVDILITNGASAGATTLSGFTVSGSTGDPLTTTNTNKFVLSVKRINSVCTYTIKALQ